MSAKHMGTSKAVISAFVLAFGVFANAVANTFSAEGNFSSLGFQLEWEPDCSKPYRPYSRDADSIRRYIDDAKEYVSCVNDQAEEDAEYAVSKIEEGRDDAIDDMLSEVRALR